MSESSRLVQDNGASEAHLEPSDNQSRSVSPLVEDSIPHYTQDKAGNRFEEDQISSRNGKYRSHLRDWWKEAAVFLLGTIALIAIFILLIWSNGMLLRDWHSKVSLNTTIAVLAQVAASALLYVVSNSMSQLKWVIYQKKRRALDSLEYVDNASRGPAGSIVFVLWKADFS